MLNTSKLHKVLLNPFFGPPLSCWCAFVDMAKYLVAALYHFVELEDYVALRDPLEAFCAEREVIGTLLLAREGINGTIAGPEAGVREVVDYLRSDPRFSALVHKEAWATVMPFYRLKIKLKKEIVTLGVPELKTAEMVGEYVRPEDWNSLIQDPNVVLVDTRNDYEIGIGTFKNAINPKTDSFSEFPDWVAEQRKEGGVLAGNPKVAMFCTGGIRCEKSTAYLRSQGFDEVYHLQGGILKYLEETPEEDSLWEGDCFVFDERVAVGHGLKQGDYVFCRACRMPLTAAEREMPQYEEGISCVHCIGTFSEEKLARLRERQKQTLLAQERNLRHIGAPMEELKAQKRAWLEEQAELSRKAQAGDKAKNKS